MDSNLSLMLIKRLPCGVLVWEVDEETPLNYRNRKIRLSYSNDLAEQYTGISLNNSGKTIGRFMDAESAMKIQSICKDVVTSKKPIDLKYFSIKDSCGQTFSYRVNIFPIGERHVAVCMSQRKVVNRELPDLSSIRTVINRIECQNGLKAGSAE